MASKRKIMIVTGEVSGDTHAAMLVRAIRDSAPHVDFEFFGSAGSKLRNLGVEAVVNAEELAVVGVFEIARLLPMFVKTFQKLKTAAVKQLPDVVILVDFPEFNLKLAKTLKKKGFKIVYYISPQLWAWRKYRVNAIRKYVELVISILPFEKEWYANHGVGHVEYVGNPLMQNVHVNSSKADFCRHHGLNETETIIALLPGSRHTEIVRILPVMLKAAAKLAADRADLQFLIAAANESNVADIEIAIKNARTAGVRLPSALKVIKGAAYDILNASDAAAVTSGTATLEAGIIGTPMVIVYKLSWLNYHLFKPLTSVEHIGLINLIAGKRLARELLQDEFTADSLKAELLRLLDKEVNFTMRADLKTVTDRLDGGDGAKLAAELILQVIG